MRNANVLILSLAMAFFAVLFAFPAYASGGSGGGVLTPGSNCQDKDQQCQICINENSSTYSTPDAGKYMVNQILTVINNILGKLQASFYNGIIGSPTFQEILGVAFMFYLAVYGIMITFGMASYRSGEIASRLIKLGIVYAMTTTSGWSFFSKWIEQPVIGAINELITAMANAASSAGIGTGSGNCVSAATFSGGPVGTSGTGNNISLSLQSGPLAMLFGPMGCVFGSRFLAGVQALITTGFYGWILALLVLWGLLDFVKMLFGAVITYVKAVIGLAFLFGIAPIFMAFYLFDKTRALTKGWLGLVAGFALQPVMLFAFLSFYLAIVGTALGKLFADNSGNPADICYVPWYTMPGMMTTYWMHFKNSSGVAGGEYWSLTSGSGQQFGGPMPPPTQILSILYFMVLCNLGKNFTRMISELAENLATEGGASSSEVTTTGEQVGSWFQNGLKGAGSSASSVLSGANSRIDRLFGNKGMSRPQTGGGGSGYTFGTEGDE